MKERQTKPNGDKIIIKPGPEPGEKRGYTVSSPPPKIQTPPKKPKN